MLNLDRLQKEDREAIWQQLQDEFGQEVAIAGLPEAKVKAVADILRIVSPFTLPQQKLILSFASDTLTAAIRRSWRDVRKKAPKSTIREVAPPPH